MSSIYYESNPNAPSFAFDFLPLQWQMTRWDKFALAGLLDYASPQVAIEIGTYRGGSLQILATRAKTVYSLDISADCENDFARMFPNVDFRIGDSRETLPELLRELEGAGAELGFVLVDGDHSAEGVCRDIENLLDYTPKRELFVVCHDSFNPECRKGMLQAKWSRSTFVHYVEIDFVPGVYHEKAFDTAQPRTMWGGLALALLRPEERRGELLISESQRGLFESCRRDSAHGEMPRKRHSGFVSRIRRRWF
jgi:hypothetical protein